jgi:hypothetical protein
VRLPQVLCGEFLVINVTAEGAKLHGDVIRIETPGKVLFIQAVTLLNHLPL